MAVPKRLTKKEADQIAERIRRGWKLTEISLDFRVSVSRGVGDEGMTVTVADLYGNCFVSKK